MKKKQKINSSKTVNLLDNYENLKISVLVPAHNEENSVGECIKSILQQTRKVDQIVVVNDGSTDRTRDILSLFKNKITEVDIEKCTGNKSYAQEYGLSFVTGDIFITTDADTILDREFVANILKDFQNEYVAAVCGYVKSLKFNWLTACREIDYALGQSIHKTAQENLNFMLVIPGCAAAYRTSIFRQNVSFDHDTLAEDLDFTYKLNEAGCKIKFNRQAIVYTQDPADLNSYILQMKRWYRGNWQNLKKHINIINRPKPALELSLAYLEGLLFPILLIAVPLISLAFFVRLLLIFVMTSLIFTAYAAIVSRRFDLVLYFPHYVFIVFVNSSIFFLEFYKEIILKKQKMAWFQPTRRKII